MSRYKYGNFTYKDSFQFPMGNIRLKDGVPVEDDVDEEFQFPMGNIRLDDRTIECILRDKHVSIPYG